MHAEPMILFDSCRCLLHLLKEPDWYEDDRDDEGPTECPIHGTHSFRADAESEWIGKMEMFPHIVID